MLPNWSASQPLLQASKGRREPSSPRKRRLRSLGTLLSAIAFAAAVVVSGAALLTHLLDSGGGGVGGGGERHAAAGAGSSSGSGSGGSTEAEPWTVRGLEEAYKGLASGSNPAASLADSESLAASQKRARKAAALPPPEFRSHAAGMALSPGAASAAAACVGPRCQLVVRFVLAAEEAARLSEGGGCAVQHCPDVLGVGPRPLPYSSHAFGNRCEPLWNRGALEAVRQLAAPDWRVLEWFTGGSTSWFLARVARLTSIEGAKGFASKTSAVAAAQFEPAHLAARWELHVAPPARRVLTFADTESPEAWGGYCGARFLPAGARFDLIAVQGFARMACLARAVELLEPQGGLLVLPQAQRPAYAGAAAFVPQHWLRLSDVHDMGTTLVWMSIRKPGEEGAGAQARASVP